MSGAGAITLGPVLLSYDRSYLGLGVDDLRRINDNLVHFIQHDRISMAGNMIGLGSAVRRIVLGRYQARPGVGPQRPADLWSGRVSHVVLFRRNRFRRSLHTLVVVTLFPMLLAAVWNRPSPPDGRHCRTVRSRSARRALWGQLSVHRPGRRARRGRGDHLVRRLTDVFVSTDLGYLHTHGAALRTAGPQLVSFVAHDRAGFGGALIGSGLAIVVDRDVGVPSGASAGCGGRC